MKKTKILTYIISITFIMSALIGSIHFCCFDENFYTKQHEKILLYGKHINEHIGITNEQLSELTTFTLNYLNDPDQSLDIKMTINGELREVFTYDEKAHMVDVKRLNLGANKVFVISSVLFCLTITFYLLYKREIHELRLTYRKVLKSLILIFGLISIWVLIDFDSFWTLFHKIFFAGNDLWLLDLRKDILIMIVPPEFFNNLVVRIIIVFIVIILLFTLLLKYFDRKKIKND